ncbi:MAG: hypothetical protein ACI4PY_08790 [Akkermansia muciniphila]
MPHPSIVEDTFLEGKAIYPFIPTEANFAVDAAYSYAPQIEGTEAVSNWHSSFFMYEGRVVSQILQFLVGHSISGFDIVTFLWYVSALVILVCFCVFYINSVRASQSIFVQFALGLSLMTAAHYTSVYLDFFFLSTLLITFLICYYMHEIKGRWIRVSLLITIAFLVINMVNYRKNAILLAPVFFLYAYHQYWKMRCLKLFTLYVLYLIAMIPFAISLFLPVKKAYPTNPMIESDLRIAAILRGEQELMRNKLKYCGFTDTEHPFRNSLSPICVGDYMTGHNIDQSALLRLYSEEWKSNTKTMLTAKVIQIIEFYAAGYLPSPVQNALLSIYPALKNNNDAMKFHRQGGRKLWHMRMLLLFTLSWISVKTFSDIRKVRNQTQSNLVWLVSTISVLYAASYLIVTPTPDMRYLTPSVVLGFPAAVLYVSELLKRRRQNAAND